MRAVDFYLLIQNPQQLSDKLMEWGIWPRISDTKCHDCYSSMKLRVRQKKHGFSLFLRCIKCDKERSFVKNTFFSYTNIRCSMKLPIAKFLQLIYMYSQGRTYDEICAKIGIKQKSTVVKWASYVRNQVYSFLIFYNFTFRSLYF